MLWFNLNQVYGRIFISVNMPFYAVGAGRVTGVYETYNECLKQVQGFPHAKFKKFSTKEEAEAFVQQTVKSSTETNSKLSKYAANCASKYGFTYEPQAVTPNQTRMVKKKRKSDEGTSDSATENQSGKANSNAPVTNVLKKVKIEAKDTKEEDEGSGCKDETDGGFYMVINRLTALEQSFGELYNTVFSQLNDFSSRLTSIEHKVFSSSAQPTLNAPAPQNTTHPSMNGAEEFGFTDVYTDGACTNNGATGAKAGIGIWFGPSHPLNVSAPLKGPPTNNNAEIQAARVAIKKAKEAGITRLRINTDSQFLIKCITEWIHRWKKNNWKCSTGEPVKNKDELVKLDSAIQSMEVVVWNHVRGHAGHLGNEMADKLARDGARQYNPNITYPADCVDGAEHSSDEDS